MGKEESIKIPVSTLDSLLANIANKNWSAVEAIGNTIREMAEDQDKEHFKTHGHPK
jgi:hypothetical protein